MRLHVASMMLLCVIGTLGMATVGCTAEVDFTEEDADMFVEALMSNPKYLDYINDEEMLDSMVEAMTNVMLEHPSMQTTPEEDCATTILMAAVMMGTETGEYELPPESEKDRLCEWYIDALRN